LSARMSVLDRLFADATLSAPPAATGRFVHVPMDSLAIRTMRKLDAGRYNAASMETAEEKKSVTSSRVSNLKLQVPALRIGTARRMKCVTEENAWTLVPINGTVG